MAEQKNNIRLTVYVSGKKKTGLSYTLRRASCVVRPFTLSLNLNLNLNFNLNLS